MRIVGRPDYRGPPTRKYTKARRNCRPQSRHQSGIDVPTKKIPGKREDMSLNTVPRQAPTQRAKAGARLRLLSQLPLHSRIHLKL